VKNVMIRGVLAALSLTFGVVQMAHAAADSAPQKPIAGQQTPQSNTSVPAHRIYAGQSSMAIGAVGHVGNMSPSQSTHKGTIQSGNDFNRLVGGGG
jgi:hypothetical protein